MRVTITIDCDNDAFQPYTGNEVTRILRVIASDAAGRTAETMRDNLDGMTLRDINGNTVGKVEVTE